MKKFIIFAALLLSQSFSVNALEKARQELGNEDKAVFSVLRSELKRSLDELKKKGSIPPYFISYALKENDVSSVNSSYGALYGTSPYKMRKLVVEVRVGNYDYDNTDASNYMGKLVSTFVAVDGDQESLKRDIWFQTNAAYEYAVKLYYFKKQKSSDEFKKKTSVPSFSREKSYKYYDNFSLYKFNTAEIEAFLKKTTNEFRKYPEIQFDITRANFGNEKDYLINSEGTEILTNDSMMNVSIDASTQSEDGSDIRNSSAVYYNLKYEKLDLNKVKLEVDRLAKDLVLLKKSAAFSPGTGPAILSAQAVGVLFHEAVGHRLEGERQANEEEGQTFKDSVGKKVIPAFISVYDDPTILKFGNDILNGYYKYDEQGTPGQRVELIKDGVLKNFLMSRTPIENFYQSNGHGRSYDDLVPMARMSTTIVKASKEFSYSELKAMLLKECKRQKKSHGFIIKSMMGGETETAAGGFQVFKSVPLMVYSVDAKTGKEELVRGVEIVGTPLSSVNKIIAMGNDYEVKNGYCNAESGWVRVSTYAPSALLSEIELQNKRQTKKQLPIISRPN